MNDKQEEIRSVIHFLWLNKFDNHRIYQSIVYIYGEDSISLRLVQERTKKISEGEHSFFNKPRSGRPEKNELIPKIKEVLQINSHESTKNAVKDISADPRMVKRILIEEFGMIKSNFKWIPRVLTLEINAKRLQMAKELFQFLVCLARGISNTNWT